MTIENGMTIKLKEGITLSTVEQMGLSPNTTIKLFNKQFDLKGDGGSKILDDGRVMIKGIGYFPKDIFDEVEPDKQQLDTDHDDPYCIVIVTKDCIGAYTHYDDAVAHEIGSIGVHIVCEDGQEHFHPWSYNGGIERITTKDSYE